GPLHRLRHRGAVGRPGDARDAAVRARALARAGHRDPGAVDHARAAAPAEPALEQDQRAEAGDDHVAIAAAAGLVRAGDNPLDVADDRAAGGQRDAVIALR